MNALALVEDLFDVPETEKQQWKVTDTNSLNWALRMLVGIERKKKEVNDLANEELHRIQSWQSKKLNGLTSSETYFRGLIEEYALKQRDSDPDFKNVSTPYGTVKLRKQPDKWMYDDMKLLESLKANGLTDLVRIKEEPNKADLKKRAVVQNGMVIDPDSGAVIEGVTVEGQPESVVIEL